MNLRILGIDPGSRVTGYGLIEVEGAHSRHLAHGCIRSEAGELSERLLRIHTELTAVIAAHAPGEVAIESVFVNRNVSSALVLGQARGVAILAVAGNGLTLSEYAPAQVKSAVVGHGRAEKAQIQHMVCMLLKLDKPPPVDAADALAVALCHAHLRGSLPARRKSSSRAAAAGYRSWTP